MEAKVFGLSNRAMLTMPAKYSLGRDKNAHGSDTEAMYMMPGEILAFFLALASLSRVDYCPADSEPFTKGIENHTYCTTSIVWMLVLSYPA